MWRHGDVLIAAINEIPADASPKHGAVLALGEITGHSHRFADPQGVALWDSGGQLFVTVKTATATIIHEEHNPITLPQGTYRVWMQREYTPQAIRLVVD